MKHTRIAVYTALLALAFLLSPLAMIAQVTGNYTFTSLAYPGSNYTNPTAINDNGQVAGYYVDSSSNTHGFLYTPPSTFTSVDCSGASSTQAYGVNKTGVVSGAYADSGGNHGFTWTASGGCVSLDYTGTSGITFGGGINNSGEVVGYYSPTPTFGFLYNGGNFTQIAPSGAASTNAQAINNNGVIAGYYTTGTGGLDGFTYNGTNFTSFTPPGGGQPLVYGINDAGIVAVFVGNVSYLWQSGHFTQINYPVFIQLYGINNSNQIVGLYQVSGSLTGFIGTPAVSGKGLGQQCPAPANPAGNRNGNPSVNSTGGAGCGEPITISNGNLFEQATDYITAGQNPLAFTRSYNSQAINFQTFATALGINWRSNFDRYLQLSSSSVIVERADGQQLTFTLSGSAWVTDTDVDVTLIHSGSTWTLRDHNDVTETYTAISSSEGQLNTIATRNGYTQTMHYNGSNQLSSVSDSYGRSLSFQYNGDGTLNTVSTPDSTTLTYGYTAVGSGKNLTSVTFPTSPTSVLTYVYGENGAPVNALTGIVDENSNRYATWKYDGAGHADFSQLGTNADTTNLTYNSDGTVTVSNAFGVADTYTFSTLQSISKAASISRAATTTTAAATENFTYDANGYLATVKDWNGNTTTYTNNTHGSPTKIVEPTRTTTIAYYTTPSTLIHLPKTITTTGLTTTFVYDNTTGNLLTRTDKDTTTQSVPYSTNGQTRTWTYTWNNFLLASVQNPRTDLTIVTQYGYDSSGALTSITDALTHATNITQHTGGGRPLTIVDPNSVTTTLTYDGRQRLTSSAVTTSAGVLTTSYTIDPASELTKLTLPDNSFLQYGYDTAHRVTQVTDADGNYIQYTPDFLGDITAINTYNNSSVLAYQHSATFDALGRMLTDVGGQGQTTTYTYDKNGNPLTIKDGLSHKATQVFDGLNRLTKITDANSGVTQFAYDTHDRTTKVTDANTNATPYVYDGFGDAIQQTSPDSGVTVYYYDGDANLTKKVDALAVTTNYTYDKLDRILTRTYPADSTQNAYYTYDNSGGLFGFGIGRLTNIVDAAGFVNFRYDERGNNIAMLRYTNPGNVLISQQYFAYDGAGRIYDVVYPSGIQVGYNRDAAGLVWQLNVTPPNSSTFQTVAYPAYEPFGPAYYFTFGDGEGEARYFDLDYRSQEVVDATTGHVNVMDLKYVYDAANNVKTITDTVNSANNQTLGYDTINRLTTGSGSYGSYTWGYDKVGNLTSLKIGTNTTTYGYTPGSNRLATIGSTTVATNANGNITSIPPANSSTAATFGYNVANRLNSVTGTSPAVASVVYDGFGQRYSKQDSGSSPITYNYDLTGNLLEENNSGSVTDYIYLNGAPIALFVPNGGNGTVYYIHTDRQGVPQVVTDSTQTPVWSTTYQPYGTTPAIVSGITQNLRFPGQYSDLETGFYYNLNRDYMPNLGRYLEVDPIGIQGGADTFLYATANPGAYTDKWGLCTYPCESDKSPREIFHDALDDAEHMHVAEAAANAVIPEDNVDAFLKTVIDSVASNVGNRIGAFYYTGLRVYNQYSDNMLAARRAQGPTAIPSPTIVPYGEGAVPPTDALQWEDNYNGLKVCVPSSPTNP